MCFAPKSNLPDEQHPGLVAPEEADSLTTVDLGPRSFIDVLPVVGETLKAPDWDERVVGSCGRFIPEFLVGTREATYQGIFIFER